MGGFVGGNNIVDVVGKGIAQSDGPEFYGNVFIVFGWRWRTVEGEKYKRSLTVPHGPLTLAAHLVNNGFKTEILIVLLFDKG